MTTDKLENKKMTLVSASAKADGRRKPLRPAFWKQGPASISGTLVSATTILLLVLFSSSSSSSFLSSSNCFFVAAWTPLTRILLSRVVSHRPLVISVATRPLNNNKNNNVDSIHQQSECRGRTLQVLRGRLSMSTSSNSRRDNSSNNEVDVKLLRTENSLLRDTIRELQEENQRLQQRTAGKIVLETFEGERYVRGDAMEGINSNNEFGSNVAMGVSNGSTSVGASGGITMSEQEQQLSSSIDDGLWCDDVLEDGTCPLEPTISFGEALRDRAYWLVGLLVLQSLSGIILARNEALLVNHPEIVYYLTMMVGAGGNAGNQASVRVIRGLALGTLNEQTRGQFLTRELKMAASLSLILSAAGFCRAIAFRTAFPEAITVTSALFLIVFTSICLGAVLPLLLERVGVDPAHSSTTIQVIMDIAGVFLAVLVSKAILDGPLGVYVLSKLGYI